MSVLETSVTVTAWFFGKTTTASYEVAGPFLIFTSLFATPFLFPRIPSVIVLLSLGILLNTGITNVLAWAAIPRLW